MPTSSRKRGLIVMVAMLLAMIPAHASGQPLGFRWVGTLHYSSDGLAQAIVDSAIYEWTGHSSLTAARGDGGIEIRFEVPELPYAIAEAIPYVESGETHRCLIRIDPRIWQGYAYQRELLVHEIGHCLGFAHVATESVMHPTMWWLYDGLTVYDLEELHNLYPPMAYTVIVGGLAR